MNELEQAANYDAILRRAKAMRAEAVADLARRVVNFFRGKKAVLPARA